MVIKKLRIWLLIVGILLSGLLFIINMSRRAVDKAKMAKIKSEISHVDVEIEALRMKLTPYPPVFKDDQDKKDTTDQIEGAINYAKSLLKEIEDNKQTTKEMQAKTMWQIGELYRLEHNLDIKGAWKNSEDYLLESMDTYPNFVKSYITLGMLYVNSDITKAHDAEELFLKAKLLAKNKDDLYAVYSGLFFAYYYQFRLDKALEISKEALQKFPDEEEFIQDVKIVETVLKRRNSQ